MGIETGQQTDLSLIPERGSRIRPADTYMRPTIAPVNEGYKGMMDALGGLSDKLNNYSQEQQKVNDKNGIDTAQTAVAQIQKEYGTSAVTDTQVGASLPQSSMIVQHHVHGILGAQAAQDDMQPLLEQWNNVKGDPDKSQDFIQDLRDNTNERATGNVGPFWSNSYKATMDGYADKLETGRQNDIAASMTETQKKGYLNEQRESANNGTPVDAGPVVSVQGITGSYQGENQECASLTKALAPDVGHASEWKQGEAVQGNTTLAAGTPIATFNFDGKYGPPSAAGGKSGVSHTGIYMGQDKDGVKILDQFNGSGGAKVRVIPWADWNGNTQEAGNKFYAIAGAKPVNLPSTDAGHAPDVDGTASTSYASKVMGVEGGGDPNAKNPNSSASGYGQFIKATGDRLYAKLGLTGPISSYANQSAMVDGYAAENAAVFKDKDVPVNDTTLRLAHFLGPQGAVNLLKAPTGTKASDVLDAAAISANPSVLGNGKTVDQVKQWSAKQMNGSTDPDTAAQNNARAIDQKYGRQGSLNDQQRRDSFTTGVISDLQTGDKSTLKAYPPEWIDASTQHDFDQAKAIGDKLLITQRNTDRAAKDQAAKDESNGVMQGLIEKAAKPDYVPSIADVTNPRTGLIDKAAWDYQKGLAGKAGISDSDSKLAVSDLEEKIASASATGDWSKLMPTLPAGKQPTSYQVNKLIHDADGISPKDAGKMIEQSGDTVSKYTLLQAPEIKTFYNAKMGDDVKAAANSLMVKLEGKFDVGKTQSFIGGIKNSFDTEMQTQWRAYITTHGEAPTGLAELDILNKAKDVATEKMQQLIQYAEHPELTKLAPTTSTRMGTNGKPTVNIDLKDFAKPK